MNTKEKWSLAGTAGVGLGLGAGLMYLLDPQGGRGRRALARDKSVAALKKGGQVAAQTSRDLGNRTKVLISDAGTKLRESELVTDLTNRGGALLKDVRRSVRRAVTYPAAIEAAVEEGKVVLRGLVLASEVAGLMLALEAVEGVREIQNQLEIHESVEALAAFRNNARRWAVPAARVLTGGTGSALALAGLKRKDKVGAALGALGLGLIAHGLTNFGTRGLAALRDRKAPEENVETKPAKRARQPHRDLQPVSA
ncbi:MAG TPA: hypothetical protein VIE43_01870 [Thermoanaerobaculia bacterium]|nr:hypothetical protein [Thermoanaerobaculia bacterium]